MFYLNTIEQLFLFVEQVDQLEVCLPDSRLLTGIPILAVFQNLRWNSNKTSLQKKYFFKKHKIRFGYLGAGAYNQDVPDELAQHGFRLY